MGAYAVTYLAALFLGCGYAFARGRLPERWGATIVVVGMISSNVAGLRSGHLYVSTDTLLLMIDIAEAVALTILACTVNRFWPLWAAMFQLDAVFTHVVMFSDSMPPASYAFTLKLFALPLPLLIGLGTWRCRRRGTNAIG